MGESTARAVACMEAGWLDRLRSETIYRYEMPLEGFAGMWVARETVEPIEMQPLSALDACLAASDVELRVMGTDLAANRVGIDAACQRHPAEERAELAVTSGSGSV